MVRYDEQHLQNSVMTALKWKQWPWKGCFVCSCWILTIARTTHSDGSSAFVLADICHITSDQTLSFKLIGSQCTFYSYLHAIVFFCPIPLRIKPHHPIRFSHYEVNGSTGTKHHLVTDLCHCSPIRACLLWMNNTKYVKECTYDLKIYFQKQGIVTLSVYVCKA